jgi:hypothetical protein
MRKALAEIRRYRGDPTQSAQSDATAVMQNNQGNPAQTTQSGEVNMNKERRSLLFLLPLDGGGLRSG